MYALVATDPIAASLGAVFRVREERKVREAGIDPARLPPGQHMTEKWPVLHAGSVPHVDLATWTLRVFGEVEQEVELTWEQFNALPRSGNVQDIHCVTRWSRFDTSFEGVHWRELAKLARPLPSAHFAIAWAEHDFTANVPLALARGRPGAARDPRRRRAADARPRLPAAAGRSRTSTSGRAPSGCAAIELLPIDRPGFWERYGYHNDADPWKEERFAF